MTDDQHDRHDQYDQYDQHDQYAEGAPGSGGRWDPLPQGDYDDGATAFVKLPEGGIDALLASADSPLAAPGHGYVPPHITATPDQPGGDWGTPPEAAQWPDPNTVPHESDDRFAYRPDGTQQWAYQEPQAPGAHDPGAGGQDVTGQWSIPVAGGELPDESGEFTASSLVQQWGGTPPATLPGGASAPWATEPADPAGYATPTDHPADYPGAEHQPGPAADYAGQADHTGLAEPPAQPGQAGQFWGSEPGAHEYGTPAHGTPTHDGPAYGTPAHGTPVPENPVHETPAHGVPVQETPAGGTSVQETPVQGTPAHGVPVGEAHVGEAHAPVDAGGGEADGAPHAGEFASEGDESAGAASRELAEAGGDVEPAEVSEGAEGAVEAVEGLVEPEAAPVPDGEPAADGADTAVAPAETDADGPAPPGEEHPLASYVLRVNGVERPVTDAWIGESLLYVLRERLGLAGAKDGCSQGECGACNVQVDGRLVASCLVPAVTAAGSEVRTVEGLAQDGRPSDVQRALARCGAVQCGFCVPGMAMTVHDLLEGNPAPTELETRQALCGNLCRCSGYRGFLDAVNEVVAEREGHSAGDDVEPDGDQARIPHQAGPGSGGVNPSAFDPSTHDQAYGQDGGQA
ncbi:2Fe-2S iron-sulfur cluster-binding protein [Streptomyces sp. NPDC087294]|uniref:2Fe-2S iron-sulfur cluster-binding protein n=1 Tax=Streptomyces sp. NPDC087294 TaxID=3365777 RepID=UPI00381697FC